MIAYLEGEVRFLEDGAVIVMVAGLGYRVFTVGVHPEVGDKVEFYIHQHIREDRSDLFGFPSRDYLKLFLKITDISGVGTKLAQKLLNSGQPANVMQRIAAGDIDFLVSIPGVGKKTAQKIILELKGVLVEVGSGSQEDSDTFDALMSLGYTKQDCEGLIQQLTATTPEGRIKQALKLLAR